MRTDTADQRSYKMGPRVNEHCPYDETTLRVDLERPGWHVCPVCYTPFKPRNDHEPKD